MAIQTDRPQGVSKGYEAYKPKETKATQDVNQMKKMESPYGKTIGEPKLSEEGQKYYEQLKKKYGQYDFILVSSDQKQAAQANAAKYANRLKTVVLIDDEKIERMATDAEYRKKYEGILSGATNQLEQMKSQMQSSGANVKGYGIQVNDGGTLSFFAVLKKSSADQKARIEKKAEEKKAQKHAEEKKAHKKEQAERLEKKRTEKSESAEEDEAVTITAKSLEELMQKIADFTQNDRMNSVQTDAEKMVGQHIDFKG